MEKEEIIKAINEAAEGLKKGTSDAKEQAEKALEQAKSLVTALEQKASAEELKTLRDEFEAEKSELQKEIDKLALKVKTSEVIKTEMESIIGQLKTQFFEKAAELSAVHKASSGVVNFVVKAPTDPISTGSFGDRVIFGFRERGIDSVPLPQRFVFDIITVMNGGPGSNPLSWVEQVNIEGAPAWQQGESAVKSAMNWEYIENKVTAEMIAVYTIITRQALLNWPILEQEIRGELSRKLYNKLDQAVLNGDGTANSIFGIDYYATDFDPGTVQKDNASNADVLRVAIGQVRKGGAVADPELGGFNPTYIVISEDAATEMDISVNANGTYLLPPFTSADNTKIKGIPIITTNFIGDDDFLVGDFSRYLFNIVDGLKIDVGYINDQFIRNQLTIRAELYGMGRVKNHEKPAFVKGNFTEAKELLSATT